METEPLIHCPKCNSTQIVAGKKGFSGKKAVVGAVLTGGIGIFAGTLGSNKIIITCLNCGNQFKPGEKKVLNAAPAPSSGGTFKVKQTSADKRTTGIVVICIFLPITIACFYNGWDAIGVCFAIVALSGTAGFMKS